MTIIHLNTFLLSYALIKEYNIPVLLLIITLTEDRTELEPCLDRVTESMKKISG